KRSPALSMQNHITESIKGRKIALLAADGVDETQVEYIKKKLDTDGATLDVISKNLGMLRTKNSKELAVDKTFSTTASVLYDAVMVTGGTESVKTLIQQGDAIKFINESYRHCKTIAALSSGLRLLEASSIQE